ncbi:MAG TPA: hypothetical protein VFQ76_05985 [Longimicrobiaceae bacterium]|nr:hypothetical protein [Longimicrobiaceae bacterium]
MKRFPRVAGACLALLLCAGAAPAQEDARVLRRGYLALKVGGEFTQYDSRRGGASEGLGAPFATPFPAALFPSLNATRDSLAGFFRASARPGDSFALAADDFFLGNLSAELAADGRRVPIALEAGLTSRLMLRLTVPVVRRETELVSLRLADAAFGVNVSPDSLAARLEDIDSALVRFGRLPFVPVAGSRAANEMQRRYTQATGDSTPLPLPTVGLGRTRLNELLLANRPGVDALPIGSAPENYRLGDVELAAKLQLLGGTGGALSPRQTGARLAVEAGVRIPTATGADVDSLTEIVGDEGHAGANAALFADVPLGRRLWVGAQARYGLLLARDVERATWNPLEPWDSLGSARTFSREPGARLEAALAPTYQLTDQLALSARYAFAHLGATTYAGEPDPGSAPAVFAGLESTAAQTLQTLGVGMGYSTLGAFVERRTNIPLEIWLTYDTAIAGSGGAPDVGVARLTGRIWVPAWGGR